MFLVKHEEVFCYEQETKSFDRSNCLWKLPVSRTGNSFNYWILSDSIGTVTRKFISLPLVRTKPQRREPILLKGFSFYTKLYFSKLFSISLQFTVPNASNVGSKLLTHINLCGIVASANLTDKRGEIPMSKVFIVLKTPSVPFEPDVDDPFSACPQTKCITYTRRCELSDNWHEDKSMGHFGTVLLYGEKYPISSHTYAKRRRDQEYGVTLSEEQIAELLVRARKENHRWRKKPLTTIDFTRHSQRLLYGAPPLDPQRKRA